MKVSLWDRLAALPRWVMRRGAPGGVREPVKELRFTRARQAAPFWLLGVTLLVAGLGVLAASTTWFSPPSGHRVVENGWWALVPLGGAAVLLWAAVHLTRHAYVIFTPIGVEIFPLWFPGKNLNVLYWPEIERIGFDEAEPPRQMVIDVRDGSKVFLTLSPIARARLPLLVAAAHGRMAEREEGAPEKQSLPG